MKGDLRSGQGCLLLIQHRIQNHPCDSWCCLFIGWQFKIWIWIYMV